jgi:hypothetical protein
MLFHACGIRKTKIKIIERLSTCGRDIKQTLTSLSLSLSLVKRI